MKEWIYEVKIHERDGSEEASAKQITDEDRVAELVSADDCDKFGISQASASVYLRLCCSVGDNLKPEQLFGEMFRSYGHELPRFALQVHRLDLLTRNEAGDGFVSLGDLGNRIE